MVILLYNRAITCQTTIFASVYIFVNKINKNNCLFITLFKQSWKPDLGNHQGRRRNWIYLKKYGKSDGSKSPCPLQTES